MTTDIPLTPEQRAQHWHTIGKVAAFGVLGLIVSPIIGLAIYGMVGILIAAAIGFGSIMFAPVVGTWAFNARLKMIKAEAAKNPIETLQAELQRQLQVLEQKKAAIETFNARIATFDNQIDDFRRNYPEEVGKYEEILDKMKQRSAQLVQQYKAATAQTKSFSKEIEKAEAIWKMAQAAAEAMKCTPTTDDFYAKIKVGTSIDAVRESMNRAISTIDTASLDDISSMGDMKMLSPGAQQALPAASGTTIDITATPIKAKTR